MQPALHITTKVLPGDRVELQLPSGSEGQEVDIFIILAANSPVNKVVATSPISKAEFFAQLAEMAADPDIQAEVAAINAEFAVTEMDGLHIE
jgi:hypothetical protein